MEPKFKQGETVYFHNRDWRGIITFVDKGFYDQNYYHVSWDRDTPYKSGRYNDSDLIPEFYYHFLERIKDRLC